jgi:hypothetical protein
MDAHSYFSAASTVRVAARRHLNRSCFLIYGVVSSSLTVTDNIGRRQRQQTTLFSLRVLVTSPVTLGVTPAVGQQQSPQNLAYS